MRPLRIWRASELRTVGLRVVAVRGRARSATVPPGPAVAAVAPAKIDLRHAPSSMELIAESWRT